MDHGLVSIVLPTYNCAHFLSRAIRSILDQTYSYWELLVIDNHSSDNTMEIVHEFNDQRIKIYKIYNEGVIAKSRNFGVREATGRWVAFLDADDWWYADKLQASVQVLILGHDIVYHDLVRVRVGWNLFKRTYVKTRELSKPVFLDLLSNGNGITNSSVVVCRKILLEVGGLSEDPLLVACEDYECWLRIAKKTEKFVRLRKPYGFYWVGNNNLHLSTNSLNYIGELCRLYFPDTTVFKLNTKPVWLICAVVKALIKEKNYGKALIEIKKIKLSKAGYRDYLKFFILKLLVYKGLFWRIKL